MTFLEVFGSSTRAGYTLNVRSLEHVVEQKPRDASIDAPQLTKGCIPSGKWKCYFTRINVLLNAETTWEHPQEQPTK